SKSNTTIIKIEIPMAMEYTLIEAKNEEVGINENREPKMAPTRCPPITFLGFAVTLSGLAKTTYVVAPKDETITTFRIVKTKKTMKITKVASTVCST
ncbi:MAG: hypothetical protein SVK08_06060, partial [Halobacteriota archaeon]|nr:hypothetical protein [Halobacteriota archaeon]